MLSRTILILILIFPGMPDMFAQKSVPSATEDSLALLFEQFQFMRDTKEIEDLNSDILGYMSSSLKTRKSFDYRFDSLRKRAGILDAPDGKFRIFTWNISLGPHDHQIYGILQVKGPDSCRVHVLQNRIGDIPDLLHAETEKSQWPGALYYDIRLNKRGKIVFYTLIGYNFHDRWSDKKIIEILHFDDKQDPLFGRPVFKTPDGLQHRVVFEYSGDVAMNLRYNKDLKMIVYDHLAPIEPELKAHPRFYAPDFSYDGYKFRRGFWEHRSDVDVRNL